MQIPKKTPVVDRQYDAMVDQMQARLNELLGAQGSRLYTTKTQNLFGVYLAAFPDIESRQHHNCHACQSFIERYGGLVVIDEHGRQTSAMWKAGRVPEQYRGAIFALQEIVENSEVDGVFYSQDVVLGHPETNGWTHFAVSLPKEYLKLVPITLDAGQHSAAKREDRNTVLNALVDYDLALLDQAVAVLEADALTRSEKFIGPAKWLAEVGRMIQETKDRNTRNNLLWRYVALAPAGFCHPRAGMLGTLYEDLRLKLPFDQVKQRFAEKMHPLQYQRPTAAPKAGAIDAAEKLAAQLGIINSLKRRLLRLDEVDALWRSDNAPAPAGGVFGHLRQEPKAKPVTNVDAGKMTWAKFQKTLLPKAKEMQAHVGWGPQNFVSFTTAVDKDAPPIIQWDRPERRNPAAWYVYIGGSSAESFNMTPDSWAKVEAVAERPSKWHGTTGFEHHGDSVVFCLEGCKDKKAPFSGLALFPEFMRNELHGVRAVIEAHSNQGKLEPAGGPEAAGLGFSKNSPVKVRVLDDTGTMTEVEIDRWD